MENNIKANKVKRMFQFGLFMLIVGAVVLFAIYSDSHPDVIPKTETKIGFGQSYLIGKYSPYIIGGIVLVITIFRNIILTIYEDIKEKIKQLIK